MPLIDLLLPALASVGAITLLCTRATRMRPARQTTGNPGTRRLPR